MLLNRKKLHKVYCGVESDCINPIHLFNTNGQKKTQDAWLARHQLFSAKVSMKNAPELERVIIPVIWCNRIYGMDAVTGSLYRHDGSCLTSDNLNIVSIKHDRNCVDMLRNAKAVSFSDELEI